MTKEELNALLPVFDKYIEENSVSDEVLELWPEFKPKKKKRNRNQFYIGYITSFKCVEANHSFLTVDSDVDETTFQEKMFQYIDEKDLDEVEFYKAAHIDRKLFSKIRSNDDYQPNIKTAIAIALTLKLSLAEAEKFINLAGFSLNKPSKWNLIIRCCFESKIYDIMAVNAILDEYHQPILVL